MSRYAINPPDEDKYEVKPVDDCDVPDFDQPDSPVDSAEHAAHALIEALGTLAQEIAKATDLERANQLRKMLKRAWADVTRVTDNAGDKVDQILERRR